MLQINNPLKTPKRAPRTHSSIRYGDLSRRRYQHIELTFSGTVSYIHTLWNDDYTVMIRGNQGGWIWEVEHVINVEVRVGERVEAGQQVATASDFAETEHGKGFGVVELGLLEGGLVPIHHCPLLCIDQTALPSITDDLEAIRQENLQHLDRQGYVLDPVNDPYGQACWTHDPIRDE